jgi:predicted signal transduction protein with EAL and GGDEF domain
MPLRAENRGKLDMRALAPFGTQHALNDVGNDTSSIAALHALGTGQSL